MELYDKLYAVMKKSVDGGSVSGANLLVCRNGREEAYSRPASAGRAGWCGA